MINLNLEHLNYFRYACQCKSLSQAAEQAGISPQGLSKAMGALEARLEGKLFTRDVDGERSLTEYGQALLQCAEACADAIYKLESETRAIRAREQRIIRIGGWDIASRLGHDFPGTFERAHPGVSIEYLETPGVLVEDMLLAKRFDLGLVVHPYHPELIVRDAITTPVYFFVHAAHPLANHERIMPQDLEGVSVHMPGEGFKSFESIRETCKREGVKLGPLSYGAVGYGMYEYVSQNMGVGWGLGLHAKLPIFQSNPKVRCIPSWMTLKAGIGYLRTHVLTEDEQMFIDYFTEAVEEGV